MTSTQFTLLPTMKYKGNICREKGDKKNLPEITET